MGIDVFFEAFGSVTDDLDRGFVAVRTYARHGILRAAVVAYESFRPAVIGERYVAVVAFWHKLAQTAPCHGRIAATVVEQHYLAVVGKSLTATAQQGHGYNAVGA